MKLSKCLKHALKMVVHSKLRSWLTILGIVIGVASVIAIVSLGEGLEKSITEQLGDLGGSIITITPGFSRGGDIRIGGIIQEEAGAQATDEETVLDRTDVQALRGLSDIELIDTQIRGNADVSYLGKSGSVGLIGVDQKVWSRVTTNEIRDGRMLNSADQNVIVIGGGLADSFFDQPLGINKVITIGDSAFRIVGILDDESNSIVMPIQMAYQLLDDKEKDVYDSLVVKIRDEDKLDAAIEKIEKKLMITRHVTETDRDFSVSSSQQMNEMRSGMISSMSAFLTAIAAVSLLVGSVGISNTMFTSVLEKTKEIGIMKAIGARNKDILAIFLFYAGLIGLAGGTVGVILGIIISGVMPYLMSDMPLARGGTFVSVDIIVIALSVSVLVGIIAGFVPAYQGSKLRPVDALRYE
ncbi:MAG TPA: ABC transporter permease [Methanosarcinales archaeon]|nr:ABC transporter permease [Methanosarcinales archaeon]